MGCWKRWAPNLRTFRGLQALPREQLGKKKFHLHAKRWVKPIPLFFPFLGFED